MTDHPITPPPELVKQVLLGSDGLRLPGVARERYLITAGFRAGADQELEACCEWLSDELAAYLRAKRRPNKPPSLAERALALLDDASTRLDAAHENTIRRALERLQELENND